MARNLGCGQQQPCIQQVLDGFAGLRRAFEGGARRGRRLRVLALLGLARQPVVRARPLAFPSASRHGEQLAHLVLQRTEEFPRLSNP